MNEPIKQFTGEFRWLSNFWEAPVRIDGHVYLTVEHWYQSRKTLDPELQISIRRARTAADAKRMGKHISLRSDWNDIRISVMQRGVKEKFLQHPDLRKKLIETGDSAIIEGNTWGDRFWGQNQSGQGKNMLGQILMQLRDELRLLSGAADVDS